MQGHSNRLTKGLARRSIRTHLYQFLLIWTSFFLVQIASAASSETRLVEIIQQLKGKRPVTLTVLYPEGSLPNVEAVAKRFTQQTGIRIRSISTSVDDINTKLTIDALRGKSGFDIALPATFGIPDLAESGILCDITEWASEYEAAIGYTPSLHEIGNSYKNRKYGYQTDGDTYLMFFNRAWYESPKEKEQYQQLYGEPLSLPDSWRALDQHMAFFHRPDQGRYGGMLFRTPRYMVWEWWLRFLEKGSLIFDQEMRPLINSPSGIDALKELIAASEYQHPSVGSNGLLDNWKQFAKGISYANIGWGGTQKFLRGPQSLIKDYLISAPTPGGSYFNWGWSYVVSEFSDKKELAYLFTLYATLPGPSTAAIREDGFFDPFRNEHYEDPAIIERYTEAFLKTHRETMDRAIPDLYIEGHDQYIEVLQEAIRSAYEGTVSPEEAMAYAAREWQNITNRIGRDQQIRQWKYLLSKFPEQ